MPRTRSGLSSSITSSRVWPELMQRRSAASTVSSLFTVTSAGVGVITCRACCSCRWNTPSSMSASPGSSRADLLAAADQAAELIGARDLRVGRDLDPEDAPDHEVRPRVERPDHGAEGDAEPVERTRDPARDRLGVGDRHHLRRLLPDDHVQRRDDHVGDPDRDRDGRAVSDDAAECGLDHLRDRGLAEEAEPDRGHRDPDLRRGEVLVDAVELLRSASVAPFEFVASSSSRVRRERTSANSAATKSPFTITSRTSRKMKKPGTSAGAARAERRLTGAGGPTQPDMDMSAGTSRRVVAHRRRGQS